jgi:hypothetical protein
VDSVDLLVKDIPKDPMRQTAVPIESIGALMSELGSESKAIRRLMTDLLKEIRLLRHDVRNTSKEGIEKANEVLQSSEVLVEALRERT